MMETLVPCDIKIFEPSNVNTGDESCVGSNRGGSGISGSNCCVVVSKIWQA